jgi:hypothetical protein
VNFLAASPSRACVRVRVVRSVTVIFPVTRSESALPRSLA